MNDAERPRGYDTLQEAKQAIIEAEFIKRAAARVQFAARRKPVPF